LHHILNLLKSRQIIKSFVLTSLALNRNKRPAIMTLFLNSAVISLFNAGVLVDKFTTYFYYIKIKMVVSLLDYS